MANFHRLGCDVAQVRHELGIGEKVCSSIDVVRASKLVKLKGRRLLKQPMKVLATAPLPAMLEMKDGAFFIYGRRHEDGRMRLVNAVTREVRNPNEEELAADWTGTILLFTRRASLKQEVGSFSLAWFLPSLWRYRRPLMSVVVSSLFIQLCTLATPLLFQIVIDKVLTHKGMSTLYMVILGMCLVGLFQALLTWLRTYMLTHTTSRIDVELGAKLFDHMVRLPLNYFETRATGQTVARMREIEQVRNFLTGSALLTGLDVIFSVVLIVVMVAYSPFLSVIALLSLPVYVADRLHHAAAAHGADEGEVQQERPVDAVPGRIGRRHPDRQGHGDRARAALGMGGEARRLRRVLVRRGLHRQRRAERLPIRVASCRPPPFCSSAPRR